MFGGQIYALHARLWLLLQRPLRAFTLRFSYGIALSRECLGKADARRVSVLSHQCNVFQEVSPEALSGFSALSAIHLPRCFRCCVLLFNSGQHGAALARRC